MESDDPLDLLPRRVPRHAAVLATLAAWAILGGAQHSTAQDDRPALSVVEQFGGATGALAVADDLAFVGVGPRVLTVDLADPRQPRVLGRTAVLPDAVHDLAVDGRLVYVAAGGAGLVVIDVTDPVAPREVAQVDLPGDAVSLALAQDVVFCAVGEGGVVAVSVADPTRPRPVGELALGQPAMDIAVSGDLAFVLTKSPWTWPDPQPDRLRVLDVRDVRRMAQLGTLEGASSSFASVAAVPGFALLGSNGGMLLVDARDPSQPRMTSSVGWAWWGQGLVVDVAVDGGLAYAVTDGSIFEHGTLIIADVQNPLMPELRSRTDFDMRGRRVAGGARGGAVLVATNDNLLRLFSADDPGHPQEAARLDTFGPAYHLDLGRTHGYAVVGDGLRTFTVSDPLRPEPSGAFLKNHTHYGDIAVGPGAGYVVVQGEGDVMYPWIHLLSLADPARPVAAGDDSRLGRDLAMWTRLRHDRSSLFVASYSTFTRYDVSAPLQPRASGSITVPTSIRSFAVAGDHACLVHGDVSSHPVGSLRIVDLSATSTLQGVGELAVDLVNAEASTEGKSLYLAGTDSGGRHYLAAFDISQPTRPQEVARIGLPQRPYAVAALGSYVTVGMSGRVEIIDVSAPALPHRVSRANLPAAQGDIRLLPVPGSEELAIYLAAAGNGVYLLRFDPDALPDDVDPLSTPTATATPRATSTFIDLSPRTSTPRPTATATRVPRWHAWLPVAHREP